eukprot:GFUD01135734.1.p1 GENE.GFUD01135734.1~~GFUD01135734.1.p1  ORF type:complete len:221 (-),score=33.02 GFUD01135734.1:339-1001(-)
MWLAVLTMGMFGSKEKPLARTFVKNKKFRFSFCNEDICPEFLEVDFDLLEKYVSGSESDQIKENFRSLLDQINLDIKAGYKKKERKRLVEIVFYSFWYLTWAIAGFYSGYLLVTICSSGNWLAIIFSLPILIETCVLLGLVIYFLLLAFGRLRDYFFGTTNVESRMNTKIETEIEKWNQKNEQYKVFAWPVENGYVSKIFNRKKFPTAINLWKGKFATFV